MSVHTTISARRRALLAGAVAAAALAGIALVAPTAPVGAAFPGADGRIAWATAPIDSDENLRIVSANPDGTLITELTDGTTYDSAPAYSPDGTKILFQREIDQSEVESIWVMDADGSNQMPVIEDESLNREPAWSPDGSQLVFTSNRNGPYQIFKADIDGSNETLLVDGHDAQWAPDGTEIAFVANAGNIWTMNPDGSDAAQLTNEDSEASPFDWAPDSSKVLYPCDEPGNVVTLCTIDRDGSNRTLLDQPGVQEYGGVFSPQGNQILFYGYPDEDPDVNVLYVANADGTNRVAVGTDAIYYITSTWGSSPQQVVPTSTTTSTTTTPTVPQATPRYAG